MSKKRLSVINATLLRPEYQRLLASLHAQTLPNEDWEIIPWTGERNEYEARNKAVQKSSGDVLVFCDDDTWLKPDYLAVGLKKHFGELADLKVMDTAILVQGTNLIDKPMWAVGATLWSTRKAFDELGGFEVDWGLPGKVSGWRSDTDFAWRAIEKYGQKGYFHASDMVVQHPEEMKAPFNMKVERRFYERWKKRCIELFLPYDLRMPLYMLAIETDPSLREIAQKQLDEHIKHGYLTKEYADMMIPKFKEEMS